MNITVLDGYGLNPGDLDWGQLGELGNLTVYDRTPAFLVVERAKDSEIVITNKTIIDKEVIEQLPHLKYIGVLATGYNVVDTATAHEHGIVVTNIPSYSTMSVAQHVFALLLAVTDRVEHYASEVRDGEWSRSKDFCFWNTRLTELSGKKLGIVGYGNIGRAVARIAMALGMKVLAFSSKDQKDLEEGVEKVSLEKLLKESDVVSLHCPLTPSTKEMINSRSLEEMKTGAILINTGRGPLVDEKAVAQALEKDKLRAYCADVMCSEPPQSENPLFKSDKAYLTPHIAWATEEARKRLMEIAVNNLKQFLKGDPVNVV